MAENPKEKALSLVKKYKYAIHRWNDYDSYMVQIKAAATIAVDEIISLWTPDDNIDMQYWEQVKQEIQSI